MTTLEELKQLSERATPEPWGKTRDNDIRSSHTAENGHTSEAIARTTHCQAHEEPCAGTKQYRDDRIHEQIPNVELTIAMRNAPPHLIRCIEAADAWIAGGAQGLPLEYYEARGKLEES